MIRRLRLKFVCINMTIVTVMLCTIFGLVLHFTRYPSPILRLEMASSGELLVSRGGFYDLTDRALLEELAVLSSNKKSGVLPEYGLRYVRVVTPTLQCIVFADISSEIHTMNHLIQNCLAIGAFSFFLFLLISIFLARWAVKPVETVWDQHRQLVADAAHELKTALTVILSNAQMLSENGDTPELRERLNDFWRWDMFWECNPTAYGGGRATE